jgi:hypothetical protein
MNININLFSNYVTPIFRNNSLPPLIRQRNRIFVISTIAFACLAACYMASRLCVKLLSNKNVEQNNKNIIINFEGITTIEKGFDKQEESTEVRNDKLNESIGINHIMEETNEVQDELGHYEEVAKTSESVCLAELDDELSDIEEIIMIDHDEGGEEFKDELNDTEEIVIRIVISDHQEKEEKFEDDELNRSGKFAGLVNPKINEFVQSDAVRRAKIIGDFSITDAQKFVKDWFDLKKDPYELITLLDEAEPAKSGDLDQKQRVLNYKRNKIVQILLPFIADDDLKSLLFLFESRLLSYPTLISISPPQLITYIKELCKKEDALRGIYYLTLQLSVKPEKQIFTDYGLILDICQFSLKDYLNFISGKHKHHQMPNLYLCIAAISNILKKSDNDKSKIRALYEVCQALDRLENGFIEVVQRIPAENLPLLLKARFKLNSKEFDNPEKAADLNAVRVKTYQSGTEAIQAIIKQGNPEKIYAALSFYWQEEKLHPYVLFKREILPLLTIKTFELAMETLKSSGIVFEKKIAEILVIAKQKNFLRTVKRILKAKGLLAS